MKKVLITGGAGFIGSHLADKLISENYEVRILDNLSEQVHGNNGHRKPEYLNKNAELIVGDIRNAGIVSKAIKGVDTVYHFAAMVGVGQSMYQLREYTEVNNAGTAILLETLIEHPVKKLIVASSMSIYGEGEYRNRTGKIMTGLERNLAQLKRGEWEFHNNGEEFIPSPTPETKIPSLSSLYALSKYDQERMCLMIGKAYKIPTTALRFFNVYGTRQALSNPYTGVLAIFASRYLNDKPPLIFEDGNQLRDFVNVRDVVQGCILALNSSKADGEAINIGSGKAYTINQIANQLAKILHKEDIKPEISGKYRVGDIRHCFADISKARNLLNYEPQVSLEEGLVELSRMAEKSKSRG